jgi:hypothetical protein
MKMADRLTNIELLLMLSEDVRAQGDELSSEMHGRGVAHARRVADLLVMLDKARAVLLQEKQRYQQYFPREETRQAIPSDESVPRVVAKGPLPAHLRPKTEATG